MATPKTTTTRAGLQASIIPQSGPHIAYSRATRDYDCYVDGQLIGCRSTAALAMEFTTQRHAETAKHEAYLAGYRDALAYAEAYIVEARGA